MKEYENNIYSSDFNTLRLVSFSTKNLKLHQDTTIIGTCAFSSSSLEAIFLPEQIQTLEKYAFHMNQNLIAIYLSPNISSINEKTIFSLQNLEVLYIPEGVTTINQTAFSECPNIKFINIPTTLTNISPSSFLIEMPTKLHVSYDNSQFELLYQAGIPNKILRSLETHSLSVFNHNFIFALLTIFIL